MEEVITVHDESYYLFIIERMEEKLMELMGPGPYSEWMSEVAKEGFRKEVELLKETGLRDFLLHDFELITAEEGYMS